jgi:RNA polymerase sigma-70 factor (sigma-E family)
MESEELAGAAALRWTDPGRTEPGWTEPGWTEPGRAKPAGPDTPSARPNAADSAEAAISALYEAAAVGLIRLAYLMLGDRPPAEDVVQDAFCGLYRNWDRLADHDRALAYVRSSVLNGCRSALRRQVVGRRLTIYQPPAASAEATALGHEERRQVMQAVRRLPARQREALVLRFYLDLPEAEIARIMGLRPSSVRSATHRALKALGLSLGEGS